MRVLSRRSSSTRRTRPPREPRQRPAGHGRGAPRRAVFTKLARQEPRNADYQRQLGRALRQAGQDRAGPDALALGRRPEARLHRRLARSDRPLNEQHRTDRGRGDARQGPRRQPRQPTAAGGQGHGAAPFRPAPARAESFMLELLPATGNEAWLHYQLGSPSANSTGDAATSTCVAPSSWTPASSTMSWR